jgi:hypothetical protein
MSDSEDTTHAPPGRATVTHCQRPGQTPLLVPAVRCAWRTGPGGPARDAGLTGIGRRPTPGFGFTGKLVSGATAAEAETAPAEGRPR